MHEPDAEGAGRRPRRVPVLVPAGCRRKGAVAPAHEQPNGEERDERRHGCLRPALHEVRQVPLREEDRHAEGDERHRMAEPPRRSEPGGCARRTFSPRDDERRDRGEVVGVGRVAQTEQRRDQHDDQDRPLVGDSCDPFVEPEHPLPPRVDR